MSYTPAVNDASIQQWIAEKLDTEKLKERLATSGCDETTINEILQAFKKAVYAKRQHTGFICLGIGAFIGFLSCVTSLVNPIPDMFNWFLYGLTSIALVLIMRGLYFLLS